MHRGRRRSVALLCGRRAAGSRRTLPSRGRWRRCPRLAEPRSPSSHPRAPKASIAFPSGFAEGLWSCPRIVFPGPIIFEIARKYEGGGWGGWERKISREWAIKTETRR